MPTYFCTRCGARADSPGACDRDRTPRVEVIASSLLGTEVGNYVLVQALGEGGMGAVYRAVHPAIGSEVAIKVLNASNDAASYLREAQAVNRVRHSGLIRILDSGYLGDRRPYLVMELLDGKPLSELVGKLSPELAAYVAAEALEALHAVHDQAVVHRDLKPANVFVTREGRVVVLDFGIAKLTDRNGATPTHSSALIGTPEYMAPEQIRALAVDGRTDVYAFGVLLYETITGRRPFAAAATFEMLLQHVERPPVSPREYVPTLSPALGEVILKALEKEPARRFDTAAAMAAELRGVIGDEDRREELAAVVEELAGAARPVPLETPRPGSAPPAPATTPMRGKTPPLVSQSGETLNERRLDPEVRREAARDPTVDAVVVPPRNSRTPLVIAVATLAFVIAGAGVFVATRERATVATPSTAPRDAGLMTTPSISAHAWLEVKSQPEGASITIDGIVRGPTPIMLALPAGQHHVQGVLAGRISVEQDVEIAPGERVAFVLALPPTPVDLAVGSGSGTGSGSASGLRPPTSSMTKVKTEPGYHDHGPPVPDLELVQSPEPPSSLPPDAGTDSSGSKRKGNPYYDD